ncbi:MAG: aminotransferase class I/II-fold pyridoxal phosphate-dependent enzyme [PS1 clade bacterium]|uniref:Aminotransferase n=1 Tax=PS1 clade bacterium TaxID=2175152 RepID=A0A368E1S7_9PROT|nr:MAG: aminotransferase class I/II-fold pyridoxal phosphate-dependent enzyme [PS1 clade bacterium]
MTPSSFSNRGNISSFLAMDVMREVNMLQQTGQDICHLEVGQPSTRAPQVVLEAAGHALDSELIGYTDALGLDELRQALSTYYFKTYKVNVSPERFVITTGSSAGFILAFLACLDAGQKVAVTSPGYPAYTNIIKSLDLSPVAIPLGQENDWSLSVAGLHVAEKLHGTIDALLMASPANPTGTMLTKQALTDLSLDCAQSGRWFFSDEIYHGLTYSQEAVSALQVGDHDGLIVMNSFSKYFSMTGWRIGWMIVPPKMVRPVERLQQNLFISAPTLSQYAACAALTTAAQDELQKHVELYQHNRDKLFTCLQNNGVTNIAPADGAFYLYADLHSLSPSLESETFCAQLLKEAKVAATPGMDFDKERGARFVRFSYARASDEIDRAVDRLNGFLARFQ